MNHDGGGYIDFSMGGNILYFSQRIEEAYLDAGGNTITSIGGSVEQYHAQLGYRVGTAVTAAAAKAKTLASNFLPSVILVRPIGMFVIDESSNKLLLSRDAGLSVVFEAVTSVCTLRDVTADNSNGENEVSVLILCKDNGKVFEATVAVAADGAVTSTYDVSVAPFVQISTTSPNQNPVSITFDKKKEDFFVAVKIDDPTASGIPHVHRFAYPSGVLSALSLLKLEDVGGGKAPRDGISLGEKRGGAKDEGWHEERTA